MSNVPEHLTKQVSRYLSGFCRSKAILEDYARVIAKLEGTSEEAVKERVEKRTSEIFEEIKKENEQIMKEAQSGKPANS